MESMRAPPGPLPWSPPCPGQTIGSGSRSSPSGARAREDFDELVDDLSLVADAIVDDVSLDGVVSNLFGGESD